VAKLANEKERRPSTSQRTGIEGLDEVTAGGIIRDLSNTEKELIGLDLRTPDPVLGAI
jgi:hypothetical protein